MHVSLKLTNLFVVLLILLPCCKPETPVTSSITIKMEGPLSEVDKQLYGLTIEEINHAIDGGLYYELIQNRSFEDGVVPLNCRYDARQNTLVTPNGLSVPFLSPNEIVGWHGLSPNTYIALDEKRPINDVNKRSLMVSISSSATHGRGGVVAEGYKGIFIRKGEKYRLSFYTRTATSVIPRTINIALEDSTLSRRLSDVYQVKPNYEWARYEHVLTALEDNENAVLSFSTDSSTFFWIDAVSLIPSKTWKNRPNGLRPDIMEKIAGLNPSFIRFPGGSFVEGYTSGSYPKWKETIGDISGRKHFWNIWVYGSSNGMGFHEFLQMCEDLNAQPVYVINCGITSQRHNPRYEDMLQMEILVQDALDAIEYANGPVNSTYGALRLRNGHAVPFNLKHIEIGSNNYGNEYKRRYELFKKAINDAYPDVKVISSSELSNQTINDWADTHYYSNENFFISNYSRFQSGYNPHSPEVFIGEFSISDKKTSGTLRAAVAEACLLISAERNPDLVKRVAYAPVLGNLNYPYNRVPFISFTNSEVFTSPSYYMYKMFTENRGDEVLTTEVDTYLKPQVTSGQAGIEVWGDNYEITDIKIDNRSISDKLILHPNQSNIVLMGDSSLYNYEYTVNFKRIKGNNPIYIHVRNNGKSNEEQESICLKIDSEKSQLYYRTGFITDSLTNTASLKIENEHVYHVKINCKNDTIQCYIDNALIHDITLKPLPSLVSFASYDKENKMILLKVVNTTFHEEKTEIHIQDFHVNSKAQLIQLKGPPDGRNTLENPENIIPKEEAVSLSHAGKMVYSFPPNSISIFKLSIE